MLRLLFGIGLLILYWNYLYADFRKTETIREYIYNFSVSGGASNTLIDVSEATTGSTKLPLYSSVEEVTVKVITPLVSSSMGTSLTIGNSTSGSGYFLARPVSDFTDNAVYVGNGGLIFDNTNKIRKSNFVSGTNDRNIGLTISAGTTLTAGKLLLKVKSYFWSED